MKQWNEQQTNCLNGSYAPLGNNGGMSCNTIRVARVLADMLESMILTPGRKVLTPGRGDWITHEGKDYSCYVQFVGGGMDKFTVVFSTREQQCNFLRDKINGK